MDHSVRFEAALASACPGKALRDLAIELAAHAHGRAEVYAIFEEHLRGLRQHQPAREADEDLLLDTMDALTGWCHPDARIPTDH